MENLWPSVRSAAAQVAESTDGFGWDDLGQVLIVVATAITAVATTWAIVQNSHNRPRPSWVIDSEYSRGSPVGQTNRRSVRVKVTNIGDGPAFHASASFTGIDVTPGWEYGTPPEAKVEPGEFISAAVWVNSSGTYELDEETDEYLDTRVMEWPSAPRVRVEWREPPRRGKSRAKTFTVPNPDRRAR